MIKMKQNNEISLFNSESDVIDDFMDVEELVSLVTGEIYINDEPFGTYCAMWLSEKSEPINMLITALHKKGGEDFYSPALTIGVKCSVEGSIEAVDPYTLPWGDSDDGIMFGSYITPEEYDTYTLAKRAFKTVQYIISHDVSIKSFVKSGQ